MRWMETSSMTHYPAKRTDEYQSTAHTLLSLQQRTIILVGPHNIGNVLPNPETICILSFIIVVFTGSSLHTLRPPPLGITGYQAGSAASTHSSKVLVDRGDRQSAISAIVGVTRQAITWLIHPRRIPVIHVAESLIRRAKEHEVLWRFQSES